MKALATCKLGSFNIILYKDYAFIVYLTSDDFLSKLEALEGVSTKYGAWLRAASVEQSKNRNSRNEKKTYGIPTSSSLEDQSAKNSGTGRTSEQYSYDHERPQQPLTALVPVSHTKVDDNRGLQLGLMGGSGSTFGYPSSSQAEGSTHLMNTHNIDAQPLGGNDNVVGRDMAMLDSENISSHAKEQPADVLDHEDIPGKPGFRKWKRIARSQLHVSASASTPSHTDGKSDEKTSSGSVVPKSPLISGSVGGEKRKELSISPDMCPVTKKHKEVGLLESNSLTVEPGSQARRVQ
ncbi:hypothetical protein Q3G72_034709 [Acer saccharum]|nr:hypothetical protein Q3G72_034709 [Acer saccharum]